MTTHEMWIAQSSWKPPKHPWDSRSASRRMEGAHRTTIHELFARIRIAVHEHGLTPGCIALHPRHQASR
ncbi:MAG: hypothetical protein FWD69_15535 [Polyangiaceae bacterium]|nr:hypothetical protein [Polyangiaceae bacterium]